MLAEREQHYIDLLRPALNTLRNVERGLVELARARAALITHCPKGHTYDKANTMINQGKRVCRKCNAERVAAIYASESPEEREKRKAYSKARHEKNRPARLAAMREYVAAHKKEKRAYDKARAAQKNEKDRQRWAALSPDQQEERRAQKRAYYAANREQTKAQLRA